MTLQFEEVRWAITTLRAALAGRHGGEAGVGEALTRLDQQDLSAAAFRAPQPAWLPGCRHLPHAVGEAAVTVPQAAAAIAGIEDELAWRQNPNYSDAAMGQPGYMQNYAYAELIGPSGPFAGDDFLLGLFLLGPDLHYPDHNHAAPELYWVLTEGTEWRHGEGDFAPRLADEAIWHEPWTNHATRTGPSPLLAVYVWTRDVTAFAQLKQPAVVD